MNRPNMAMDAPPTEVLVGGVVYPIETDYRAWIEVMDQMDELLFETRTPEEAIRNAGIIMDMERKLFGEVLPAPPDAVLGAVVEFMRGYPQAPVNGAEDGMGGARRYSFDWDINAIIIAIRNQSGIDLSYRRKEPFHWWLFLEEFRALCGDHYILRLMEIRAYKGKDAELKKQARRYALPQKDSAERRRVMKELDELFYNA